VRFTDEIGKLQGLLEESRRGEIEAAEQVENLRNTLATQSAEFDALKRKSNRDAALNGVQSPQSPSASKQDLAVAREEITGLK
jgi:hypothetical protein